MEPMKTRKGEVMVSEAITNVFDVRSCVIYVRASTNEQKQKNSHSVQMSILEDFASSNGFRVEKIVREYASGTTCEREGFLEAVEYAKNNSCYLLAYRADRLARSLDVFSHIKPIFDRVRFCEIGDRPLDPLMFSVLIGMSSQESKIISLRTRAGMQAAKSRNPEKVFGNPRIQETAFPAGLKVRQGNARRFNERILSLIQDLTHGDRLTYKEIASRLNKFGVQTRRGSSWNASNVYRVMKS